MTLREARDLAWRARISNEATDRFIASSREIRERIAANRIGPQPPEDISDCRTCNGCGKVADSDQEEPWSEWLALPLGSAAAVVMGLVRPKPCPACDGTGKETPRRRPRHAGGRGGVTMAETEGTLARLRRRHIAQPRPAPNEHQPYCVACGEDWPCYTVWLLDVAEAARERAYEGHAFGCKTWRCNCGQDDLIAALAALDTREAVTAA